MTAEPTKKAASTGLQSKRWMKVIGLVLGVSLTLVVVAAALAWHTWTHTPDAADGSAVQIRIHSGMTLGAASDTLVQRGLLDHRLILVLGARVTGQDRGLQAGLYEIPAAASPAQLLEILTSGQTVQVSVTLPEGLDAREMAKIIANDLDLDADVFLAEADSFSRRQIVLNSLTGHGDQLAVLDSVIQDSASGHRRRFRWCEGYLAPDTYRFSEGITARKVAKFLIRTQLARLDSALSLAQIDGGDPEPVPLTPHGLLTLASIVEAEARIPVERPLVAAVYTNRLARGWRLEADPTVAFFLKKKGKRLFYKDLKQPSAYNTYRNRGLPPGPIGAPGLASIIAAARPDTACTALYFVSDNNGGHVFSRTAREHQAAVERFRRQRRSGK